MFQSIWLRWSGAVFVVLILNLPGLSLLAQEDIPPTSTASPSPINASKQAEIDLFFEDIVVRGQPIFQVGSVANLRATERAQITGESHTLCNNTQ